MRETKRHLILKRAALELQEGISVCLGRGLPALVACLVPPDLQVTLLAETGLLGMGDYPTRRHADPDLINAGLETVSAVRGACFLSSAEAFSIIRGHHLDLAVLGAMEVDEKGNLANWMVPGRMVKGMESQMDLAVGAKRVVVVTEHTTEDGKPKILRYCTLPLTGVNVVHRIITEMAVMDVTPAGLVVREIAPGLSVDEVRRHTEPELAVDKDLRVIQV